MNTSVRWRTRIPVAICLCGLWLVGAGRRRQAPAPEASPVPVPSGERWFEEVDWKLVVERYREPVAGDWVRIMHAVLRRKARSEAAGEDPRLVTTQDLLDEVDRYRRANTQIITPQAGNYV